MSRTLRQAVVAVIAATDSTSFGFSFWHSFDEVDWNRALVWLDVSGLALYFWHKVKTVRAEKALPLSVQTWLARCYEENRARVEAIRKESAAFNRLLEDAGVRYAILKGFALVPDYCPDPTLRTQYDHDYLIQPDALARAEGALQRAGYIPKVSREDYHIAYFLPAPEVTPYGEAVGLYSAALERPIELHVRLWDHAEEKIAIGFPEDFLDRACRQSWENFEYPALSDEDSLIFQVMHAFRHILRNWCRLSVFLEISHFLRQRASDSDFWVRYGDRSGNLRWVPEASAVVFRIAQKLFGGSVPTDREAQIHPRFSPVIDHWIEHYGLSGALANFRNNKNSLFLQREFVDDHSAWAEVWRHRLFPYRRPHRVPSVLCNRGSRGLGRKWAQFLHDLQRFKFHTFSALGYAWEYPHWRLARKALAFDPLKASGGVREEFGQGNLDPSLPPRPGAAGVNNHLRFRD